MNKLRKQSSTTYPLFFLMVDSTDHVTGKTGLSPTVTISKNGASFASPSGAITEVGNGLYKISGNATDSNTVGELWIHATGTGADPTDTSYTVVAYDPFDSVRLGLTSLPNAAAEAAGGLYTRGSGAGQINQPANGQIDANAVKIGGTVQTARDIGASVLLSPGTGTGQVSISSGVVSSNITQIDGQATSGNNATLKLKSLDIQSNDTSVSAIEIRGANGGAGLGGGKAVNVLGGSAGTGGATGADAIYVKGGGGTTTRGFGLNLDAAVGGTGLNVSGNLASAAIFSGYNGSDIRANIVGSVSGSVHGVTTLRPVINTGYSNFMFPMFDASTKSPKSGLSVTAERAIDGNPFSSCSNAVAELGNGVYRINLSASDMNGDKIMFRFTATGADDQLIEVFTQG
jgi:hypothetical protein